MEGNEIEKAAERHCIKHYNSMSYNVQEDFKAGANWQKERENAELTRANAQLDEMVTKYNELSKKYADLRKKHYSQ